MQILPRPVRTLFGLILGTNQWALPANRKLWTNFTFNFSFREKRQLPCVLEMQVKDVHGSWIIFSKNYTPNASGWDTVRANLAAFTQAPGIPAFDPTAVHDLALNIRMLKSNASYEGHFDNVQFIGWVVAKK